MARKELGLYIDRTYKVVRQDLINRFRSKNIDITPEQWVILSRLHTDGPLHQTDLATKSFRDKPTVSRILDLLVKKRLVERSQDELDARKYQVSLTKVGNQLVESALPEVQESREKGWTNLTEEEYETLVRLLDKVFTNYDLDDNQ